MRRQTTIPKVLFFCNVLRAMDRPAGFRKLYTDQDWMCPQDDDPAGPWVRCQGCPHAIVYVRTKAKRGHKRKARGK